MIALIRIEKPCEESWEKMNEISGGKFCDLCEKKVWDLDQISNKEIDRIIDDTKQICGKKSLVRPAFSSVFLALTLTSATYSFAQSNNKNVVENVYQKDITILGKLVSTEKRKLLLGEISLITLEKIYHAKADENGNFTLIFPEKALTEHNIIRIDYSILDYNNKEFTDYKSSILKTNELLGKQNFEIEEKYMTIGAVSISSEKPPDFYFFDGKKIGKRKFEKIKKENPQYKYFVFYDEVVVQKLVKRSFVNNLYLLYSN